LLNLPNQNTIAFDTFKSKDSLIRLFYCEEEKPLKRRAEILNPCKPVHRFYSVDVVK